MLAKMSEMHVIQEYQISKTGMNRLCLSFACPESAPGLARLVVDPVACEARLFRDDMNVFVFRDFPSEHIDEIGLSGGVLIAERDPPRPDQAGKFPYLPPGFAPVRRFYEASAALLSVPARKNAL